QWAPHSIRHGDAKCPPFQRRSLRRYHVRIVWYSRQARAVASGASGHGSGPGSAEHWRDLFVTAGSDSSGSADSVSSACLSGPDVSVSTVVPIAAVISASGVVSVSGAGTRSSA